MASTVFAPTHIPIPRVRSRACAPRTARQAPSCAATPRPRAVPSRTQEVALRLTRRGRLVLVGLLVLVALLSSVVLRQSAAGSTSGSRPTLGQTTVAPGESLWSVAQRIAPGRDPRPVVDQIRQLNHLSGVTVQAGQELLLPAGR